MQKSKSLSYLLYLSILKPRIITLFIGFANLFPPPRKKELKVKIRHGANSYECFIEFMNEETLNVKLAKPDKGIAPGQFAVFYDSDFCLGGGVILQD